MNSSEATTEVRLFCPSKNAKGKSFPALQFSTAEHLGWTICFHCGRDKKDHVATIQQRDTEVERESVE